jgi:hypothetical protein
VNRNDEDKVIQVFAKIGKSSHEINGFVEALAYLASLCLQAGVSDDKIIDALVGRRGQYPFRHPSTGELINSIPEAIGLSIRDEVNKIGYCRDYQEECVS